MLTILPLVVAATVVLALAAIGFIVISVRRSRNGSASKRSRDREAVLREANKQLSQNPRDYKALLTIGDIHYEEKSWEKAMKTYGILMNMSASNPMIEEWMVTMRYGLCALNLNQPDEAYKSLLIARSLREDVFDINFNLGVLEYRRGNVEKATQLLNHARLAQPEHVGTKRYLGRSLYRVQRYADAVRMLRGVVESEPDDKESLFFLAQSYNEVGHADQALMIFSHLRPDPVLGPHSALFAGTIRAAKQDYERAITDYELGLRHEKIKLDVQLELRYRLADAYARQQEIGKSLQQLLEIHKQNPGYKDVAAQIAKSKELHSNRNLQTYLISPPSEFVTLCRRMVGAVFPHSQVKILDITVQKNEYADILTEIETSKWQDTILFRFLRGTGQVGELLLRDLHARIKESRSGRGFCITAGSFSDTAAAYVEARLIDLIDKEKLLELFNRLD